MGLSFILLIPGIDMSTINASTRTDFTNILVGDGTNVGQSTISNKRDLLWNFDAIPNVARDGVPDGSDSNFTGLRGLIFDETRSHLIFGRINQRLAYEEFLAQYAVSGGWSAQCIDVTAGLDGSGSKGNAAIGYQVLAGGNGAHSFGTNCLSLNEGQARGRGCVAGAYGKAQILSTNWVNQETAISVVVATDVTAIYTAGSAVAIKMNASGQTQGVLLNKVVSSSYSAPNTTIVLHGPIPYQIGDLNTPDTYGLQYYSYIYKFGSGAVGGTAEGLESFSEGNYSQARGVGCVSYGAYSSATGRQAITKNLGEQGFSSGMIVDGTSLRWGQISRWHLKRKTTTGTATQLTLDGNAANGFVNMIRTQNNTILTCKVVVNGFCWSNQEGYSKIWDNVVLRHKSNGTTTILHESTPVEVTETTTAGYMVALSAAADGELIVTVTATQDPNRDVFWHASVEGVIAGYNAPTKIN